MPLKWREDKQGYYWDKQLYENTKSWIYEALLLILLCGFFVAGVFYGLEITGTEPELEWVDYVVQPGDTLWGIASAVKSQSVDKTIYQIRVKNGIDPLLQVGQAILIPREVNNERSDIVCQ